jgi:hypothetical protein
MPPARPVIQGQWHVQAEARRAPVVAACEQRRAIGTLGHHESSVSPSGSWS